MRETCLIGCILCSEERCRIKRSPASSLPCSARRASLTSGWRRPASFRDLSPRVDVNINQQSAFNPWEHRFFVLALPSVCFGMESSHGAMPFLKHLFRLTDYCQPSCGFPVALYRCTINTSYQTQQYTCVDVSTYIVISWGQSEVQSCV